MNRKEMLERFVKLDEMISEVQRLNREQKDYITDIRSIVDELPSEPEEFTDEDTDEEPADD